MQKQIHELFEYLFSNYEDAVFDDLQYCHPTEENNAGTDFNGKDYLKEQDCVCCEQKLIYWDKDGYLIICLYNSHPNCKYETIKEVYDWLCGNNKSIHGCQFLDYPKDSDESESETTKAYNDGLFCHFYEQMTADYNLSQFRKNAFVNGSDLGQNNITIGNTKVKDEETGEWKEIPRFSSEDLANLKIDAI